MTAVDTYALLRAVDALNDRLELALAEVPPPAPDALEKPAKAMGALIKTLKDIDAYNDAARERDESKHYISYEDYPPLRPSDRQTLIAELEALFARLNSDPGNAQ